MTALGKRPINWSILHTTWRQVNGLYNEPNTTELLRPLGLATQHKRHARTQAWHEYQEAHAPQQTAAAVAREARPVETAGFYIEGVLTMDAESILHELATKWGE
eukprot:2058692-Amphidinium_carterae.2